MTNEDVIIVIGPRSRPASIQTNGNVANTSHIRIESPSTNGDVPGCRAGRQGILTDSGCINAGDCRAECVKPYCSVTRTCSEGVERRRADRHVSARGGTIGEKCGVIADKYVVVVVGTGQCSTSVSAHGDVPDSCYAGIQGTGTNCGVASRGT